MAEAEAEAEAQAEAQAQAQARAGRHTVFVVEELNRYRRTSAMQPPNACTSAP